MKEYKKVTIEDLIADATKHDRINTLKSMAAKKIKGRKVSFLELKRNYFEMFYPEDIPRAKEKAPTFWERIEEL